MENEKNTCLIRTVFRVSLLMAGMAGSVMMFFLLIVSVSGTATRGDGLPAFAAQAFSLPATPDGTHIRVLYLTGYEGPYLEDNSGDEVVDVAALVVENTALRDIRQATVTVETTEGTLSFYADCIPAGKKLMILESNRQLYTRQQPTQLTGRERFCTGQGTADIQIIHEDMGTICVTNTSERTLFLIRLYHKNYLPESDMYIGGITYETRLESLYPGETMRIQPEHYAAGYSKILRIEADENAADN